MYDVAVIGAGVVGAVTARRLTAYNLSVCILEKENDVAMGATKANSAIVHAGFDAEEGTLKARLNVRGSEMMPALATELGVKYKNNGSLVIGFNDADKEHIKKLYERGIKNGVKNLSVIEREKLRELEPGISDNAVCALYAPTGAIICPYELTVAAVGNAMDNGAELKTRFEVKRISKTDEGFEIFSENDSVSAKYVVNCAGIYSDEVAAMVGDKNFKVTPKRGEYILLDKECGGIVSHTVFRTPTSAGKGILVSPTVDGNLLVGPTSEKISNKEDKKTTSEGFAHIMKEAEENLKNLVPFGKSITSFCGLRAAGSTHDFIITNPVHGFVNAAGIESPGLSSAPAIAEYIADMLRCDGLELSENPNFNPIREPMHAFREADMAEKNKMIAKDSSYGRIICRCEGISEGEILRAIRTNPKPCDLDGVKRRTRAQMGRCQGGFCSPYIMELLAKEQNTDITKITKSGKGSVVLTGKTKEAQ